ncbi:urease accessory protein UreE [Thiohalophilus sp.]|uniref:urease accessory protein UreE n=1 Tax=Thiohalophilus sp. TaxID=3028392 RepID=UPI003976AEC7
MLKITQRLAQPAETEHVLTLPFELRQKSRFRATLNNGSEAGLILPRGKLIRSGDCLQAEDGTVVRVEAAIEEVSTARHKDSLMIARACYHLGNRHVPLQIGEGWVRYQHDHVLDEMLTGLGLQVTCEQATFEPEDGAYKHAGHSHTHSH